MIWWVALLVFITSILDDILYVFFVNQIFKRRKWRAALLSGVLTGLVSFEGFMQYTELRIYVVPNIIGSVVGCMLAMWVEARWFSKQIEMKVNCPICGKFCVGVTAEVADYGLESVWGTCKVHGKVPLKGWHYEDFIPKKIIKGGQ